MVVAMNAREEVEVNFMVEENERSEVKKYEMSKKGRGR